MVKQRQIIDYHTNGAIDAERWFAYLSQVKAPNDVILIHNSFSLALISGEEIPAYTGESCLQHGLKIADILVQLNLDPETIQAALIYPCVQYAELNLDDVAEQIGPTIAKLVKGVMQMAEVRNLQYLKDQHGENHAQIDNLRKMMLAMVEDMRVVLIKLAERTVIMRGIKLMSENAQQSVASEIQNIYAPLANRLGIGQLKWELEDLAFRYLHADTYKKIAKHLDQKRVDREDDIQDVIETLTLAIQKTGINDFQIQGRAKHIYSIYRKMQRKNVDIAKIYDVSALRVLVNNIEECYAVLGLVHSLWEPIPEEFDDYIAHPKANGYRSLHTAVHSKRGHSLEVQVRTKTMHQEAELGVAAHWIYKEGGGARSNYDQKIAWLRQVLDWQKEMTRDENALEAEPQQSFEDRVYVFTPNGEIIDLPMGATPLDFAYTIHTELGHRCRGAKINDAIAPLTYQLKTGDRVDILTTKEAHPSRDWINASLGYLKSSRSKAKVLHWFKKQDYDRNVADGRDMLDREMKRLRIENFSLDKLVKRFDKKSIEDVYAAIGNGDLKLGHVLGAIEAAIKELKHETSDDTLEVKPFKKVKEGHITPKGITILGVGNLLTSVARCCHPVPGDSIIGYITQGRGVSIHRSDCSNILNANEQQQRRLIEVDWGEKAGTYPVDVFISAYDRHGLLRDITSLLANEKINLLAMNTANNRKEHTVNILLTLEVADLTGMSRLFDRIQQLPNIIQIERQKTGN